MQQLGESWVEMTLQLYNVGKLGELPSPDKLVSQNQIWFDITTQMFFFSEKRKT